MVMCENIMFKGTKLTNELCFSDKPSVRMRVFGSRAYSLIPEHKRDKFDVKSDKFLMGGYCTNGYRQESCNN